MNAEVIARVLWFRRQLRGRERWPRPRLDAHRSGALDRLRAHAYRHSPFYREFHGGLKNRPLSELPVLTKSVLMSRFDEVSTDRALHRANLEAYLGRSDSEPRFADRYWVSSTSGSSGLRAIVPSNVHEWSTIIASYARANEWSGISADLLHHVTMAVVSSTTPWHQSSRVAVTVRSPMVVTHRFDAGHPLVEIVRGLNDLQPQVLVAYASMIRILAEEQLRGRLRIAPRAVNCSSEVLTPEARSLAQRAWGVPPFNVYAATETGGIAAECEAHRGLHLFEDLVITEPVDAENRPVPVGKAADKLLVTVLFSRTLPLIRYELTDRVRLSAETCPCGRTFALVSEVLGRTDDVLSFDDGITGPVSVHPVVLHKALDLVPAAGWQVRQESDRIVVLVARPRDDFDRSGTADSVRSALFEAGVRNVPIDVEVVDVIAAGAAGKRPFVVRP
jgi:phenylacetate-CoA ligase